MMRLLIGLTILICYCMMLMSCSHKKEPHLNCNSRFNAEEFFTKEIESLSKRKIVLTKTMISNSTAEEKVVENVDWSLELKSFSEINISKPALINSYDIDSIGKGDTLRLIYTANEPATHLRKLEIKYKQGKPSLITAISRASNMYYNSADTIIYYGNGNYRINAFSKPKLGKEISFQLTGTTKEQ